MDIEFQDLMADSLELDNLIKVIEEVVEEEAEVEDQTTKVIEDIDYSNVVSLN